MTTKNSTPLVAATGGLRLGGSTTFLVNLGRAFREQGLELPVVYLSDPNEMAADFQRAGVEVLGPPDRRMIYEDRLREAYREIAAKRPNGVISCLGADSFELLRMLPQNAARVGVIQSDDPGPYEVVRQFAPWLDAVVGVSEVICHRLSEEPFSKNVRVEHIPYGINFRPAQPRQPRDVTKPLQLIYIGRIIEIQKRVSRLIELAKLLSERKESFEFTLVGSGPEMDSTRQALQAYSNVRMLGDVPNAEINPLLRQSDVFVLLSDYEGLPLSLLEAMGEGVVPVVSDLESGMRQVVTPETGIRIPVGNVAMAADAISELARDTEKLTTLSQSASRFVREQYSAEVMANRYLKLVRELSKEPIVWSPDANVPVPLGYGNAWFSQSWSRPVRRMLKRALKNS